MPEEVQVKKVEKLKGLERKIVVEIPEQEYTGMMHNELMQLGKSQSLKGFRKGKAPLNIIKQKFGGGVKADVLKKLMQKYFYLALVSKKLQPASAPVMDLISEDAGADLVFSAQFEVYPEVKLPSLSSLKVTRLVAEVDAAAVQEMLVKLQDQHGEWSEVDRKAKLGDQLNIDFEGKLNDEVFEGGTAQGSNLELGSGQFIPGFEDGLVGASSGEEKSIKVTFPEDYNAKDLAGKKVVFAVTVNTVSEKKAHELDEEFVKKMGIDSGKLEELTEEITTTMSREAAKGMQQQVKEELFKALLAKAKVELPNALIDSEIAAMQEDMKTRMQQGGSGQQNLPDFPREYFEKQAADRVTLGLLINEIISQESMKVDKDKLNEKIAEVAAQYRDPQEVVAWYEEHEDQRRKLESTVLEDQVVDVIMAKAKLADKKVSYEELMNPKSQQGA